MSKKLVTKDSKLLSEVENVLKQKNIPCARVQLYKKQNGDMVKSDELLLVVTNKNGESMRKAIEKINSNSKYYFGVLRGHTEYSVPKGIMKELADESKKQLAYETK